MRDARLTDAPTGVISRVATRRCEAVVESIHTLGKAKCTECGACRLVEYVDAVAPSVAAGDARRLAIQTHTEVAELAHSSLRAAERVNAHTHRYSAVYTAMDVGTSGSKPRGLERKNLVRGELLLVERCLLLLQSLNLVLESDLHDVGHQCKFAMLSLALTCSAMMPEISGPPSFFLWFISPGGMSKFCCCC